MLREFITGVVSVFILGTTAFAQPSMHEADGLWLLWSQHKSLTGLPAEQYGLWWRPEAGPLSADACRAELKRASGRPKVRFTAWYDITAANLDRFYGHLTPPEAGTWIACWPVGLDFDRDLVDK